mgnify:CR=1 FL=1
MIKQHLLPLFLLIAAGTGVYLNTLDGEWVWDDASSVLLHRHVQDPGKFFQLFREDQHAFGRGQGNFYRPLVSVSFMLDYLISGGPRPDPNNFSPPLNLSPRIFHVSNIIWHMLAGCLLYWILIRLTVPMLPALLTALIYSVHPLHTEAVAYISGRADMMSAAFMYAALLAALYGVSRASWWLTAASPLFFILALLSKESALIFPVLWLIVYGFDHLNSKKSTQTNRKPFQSHAVAVTISFFCILSVYLVLRNTVLRFASPENGDAGKTLFVRLTETGQAFLFYLKLFFYPANLHMERTLDGVPTWTTFIGWFMTFFIVLFCYILFKKQQHLPMAGLIWFLAAWFPISGIFPLNAPMAEHWMYVPMAGFWLAVMMTIWPWVGSVKLKSAFCVLICLFGAYLARETVIRNRSWHDNEILFRATLAQNPYSVRVHYNLAVTYEDLKRNWAGARRHYNRVLALQSLHKPGTGGGIPDTEVRAALARVCERMGRFTESATHYAALAARQETLLPGIQGLSRCLIAVGDGGSAYRLRTELLQALGNKPASIEWLNQLLGGDPFSSGILFFEP